MNAQVEQYAYVFVRQDLAVADQLVHASHAAYQMAIECSVPNNTIPALIVIGVPDAAAMNRVIRKLNENNLKHYCWIDPDGDLKQGWLAVGVAPIDAKQKEVMKNYRLWNPANNTVPERCKNRYQWPMSVHPNIVYSQCILEGPHEDCICEEVRGETLYRMSNLQTPCNGTPCKMIERFAAVAQTP